MDRESGIPQHEPKSRPIEKGTLCSIKDTRLQVGGTPPHAWAGTSLQ